MKPGWLHVNPVERKVDEDMNIVLVELDVGNAFTKFLVEVEPSKPSHDEDLQTYSLVRD